MKNRVICVVSNPWILPDRMSKLKILSQSACVFVLGGLLTSTTVRGGAGSIPAAGP